MTTKISLAEYTDNKKIKVLKLISGKKNLIIEVFIHAYFLIIYKILSKSRVICYDDKLLESVALLL